MIVFESAFAHTARDVEPAEVARRMASGELLLVDVREQYEWDAGRVPGARHVEIERVASSAPTIPRDRPVAFLCRGGVRAGMVAAAFQAIGYDAYNVAGGFTRWVDEGHPTEPEHAVVAEH